jgi:hypothetical protein
MKVDFFNIDEFVKQNKCPQVTNPVFFYFDKTPTSDGLFSYELFGVTDTERKNVFGYIDLQGNYLHPLIYSIMVGRMGSVRGILSGDKYAVISNGKITIVPSDYKGAQTGIDFIYKHYDEIDWINEIEEADMDSVDKKTRLKFLRSLKKEEFFVRKWLVVPPFFRAESTEDRSMGDDINKLYKDLISRTNSMKSGFGIDIFGAETKKKIQDLLLALFLESTRPIKGKGSMLRKHLLGKTIDFTASNVITSSDIAAANTPDDLTVKFGYGAYPIATVISLFQPFYINMLTDFLSIQLKSFSDIYSNDISKINLNQFSTDTSENLIKLFIKSESERFNPVEFEYTNKAGKKVTDTMKIFEYRSASDIANNKYIERELTLTDIFFLMSEDILKDKHIYVTRHPVTNIKNIYPTKVKLLTTAKTRKEVYIKPFLDDSIQPEKYENYPYIKFEGDPSPSPKNYYNFINVYIPGNVYLKAIGGDYDGDMLYMRGLFTKEANDEAERLIYAKSNLLGADGSPIRGLTKIGKEAVVSLYELTKEGK